MSYHRLVLIVKLQHIKLTDKMVKIYTKTGDEGETGLYGGKRVGKDHPRIEAIGAVDELNCVLGIARESLAREKCPNKARKFLETLLQEIQNDLFNLGCQLATPNAVSQKNIPCITGDHVKVLENFIDQLEKDLSVLRQFILPGGSLACALLHFARSLCRRAERRCVSLSKKESINPVINIYLNRLSDTLFVLARWVLKKTGKNEMVWRP